MRNTASPSSKWIAHCTFALVEARCARLGLGLLVAAMLVAVCSSSARADVIFTDDFDQSTVPGSPISSIWASSPSASYPGLAGYTAATLDGVGNADLANFGAVVSVDEYTPVSGNLRLTVKLANSEPHTSTDIFGFNDANGNRISIRGNTGHWVLKIADSGPDTSYDTGVLSTVVGTWVFNWSPTKVVITFDTGDDPVPEFDSSVNTPDEGSLLPWNFPTVSLPVIVLGASGASDNGSLDLVTLDVLPEPASLAMLAAGTLLLMRRRTA